MTPATTVDVEGRRLRLSNPDKVLYPEVGFVKADVIEHYRSLAPVLLPHLQGRPVTRKRWPNGVGAGPFFEKNAPRGTPSWVPIVELPAPGSTKNRETVHYVLVDDLPTLVWLGNLAALELHIPQWRVDPDRSGAYPDRLVFDLDPGPGTSIIQCAQVGLLLAEVLADAGLRAYPSTSGSKGLQLYVGLDGDAEANQVNAYAHQVAIGIEKQAPKHVVSDMKRALREDKVLIDWSQNNAAKTTIAPYSLRGRDQPTVATPVTWEEVEATARSTAQQQLPLRFWTDDVVDRVAEHGDLLRSVFDDRYALPDHQP